MNDNFDWINEDIPEGDIHYNEDGSAYIPIEKLYPLLDRYDTHWGHTNFKFSIIDVPGKKFASGSLELILPNQKRRLLGAATIEILPVKEDEYDLSGLEATMVSEATKNAGKKIGKRFGRYLNKTEPHSYFEAKKKRVNRDTMEQVKMKPDAHTLTQYQEAYEKGDKALMQLLEKTYIL